MATVGKIDNVARDFEWRIEDFFSLLEKQEERSPSFSFAGEDWHLKIHMNDEYYLEEEAIGYIDVYLFRDRSGPPITLRWSVGLKTADGEKVQERHFTHVFEKETEGYGTSIFFKTMSSVVVPSDVLTIVCRLEYYSNSANESTGNDVSVKCSSHDDSKTAASHEQRRARPIRCQKCGEEVAARMWSDHDCSKTKVKGNDVSVKSSQDSNTAASHDQRSARPIRCPKCGEEVAARMWSDHDCSKTKVKGDGVTSKCSHYESISTTSDDQSYCDRPIRCPKCGEEVAATMWSWSEHDCSKTKVKDFQKPRNELKDRSESNEHSDVVINGKENEIQQARDVPSDNNPFYISMFSPRIEDILESEELCDKLEENEFQQPMNMLDDPYPFFNYVFSTTKESTSETEELSNISTKVGDEEFRQHRNTIGDQNPFFNCISIPTKEGTLESGEVSDTATNVEQDELRPHRITIGDWNPFFSSTKEDTLKSEGLSNKSTREDHGEFRQYRNTIGARNPFFNSIFVPAKKGTLESEELSDKATNVEHDGLRQHRNTIDDRNPFFSTTKEDVLKSEGLRGKSIIAEENELHRDIAEDHNPSFNSMFNSKMKNRASKRKRSEASKYTFSSNGSNIITEARDEEFQQRRNIPVGTNLSSKAIFEVLNNFIQQQDRLVTENRTNRRKIIETSIDEFKDNISSKTDISSKVCDSSTDSRKISIADSEVRDVITNGDEFNLPTCPTYHNVCSLYEMAQYHHDYRLKAECLCFMKDMLSVDSFYDFIVLALRHGEKELLQNATDLFCRKTKEIIHRVKWQTFVREYPYEANQLYIKALNYNTN